MNNKFFGQSDTLPPEEVLRRYSGGPQSGIFTDGSAVPNPGPGGWGFVWVKDGEILAQKSGYAENTTNNRMELTALIEAYKHLSAEHDVEIFSDSELCVKTMNEWAPKWAMAGWKRKTGPIKNLDLVQELYKLHLQRPNVSLKWIKAHNGWLWNEYADALATEWIRNGSSVPR